MWARIERRVGDRTTIAVLETDRLGQKKRHKFIWNIRCRSMEVWSDQMGWKPIPYNGDIEHAAMTVC